MLRFLLWRLLGLFALLAGCVCLAWLLDGGPGRLLRGGDGQLSIATVAKGFRQALGLGGRAWDWAPIGGLSLLGAFALLCLLLGAGTLSTRVIARRKRRYARMRIEAHRTDQASAEAIVRMHMALHKRLLSRWWRRILFGQPSIALEVHYERRRDGATEDVDSAWIGVSCPVGSERMVEAALRTAYPNCRLAQAEPAMHWATAKLLRLKKDYDFTRRVNSLDRFEHEREPAMNRLITLMAAAGESVTVQLALAPAPIVFERIARRHFKRRELQVSRERHAHPIPHDRSMVEEVELRGGLEVQHAPLFFVDLRVVAAERSTCEHVASELRVEAAENRLVERGTGIRHGLLGLYRKRLERGEGNPLPGFSRAVFAAGELASIWHLPSIDYLTVPFARSSLPLAPAPPGIMRPRDGQGALQDALGAVTIEPELRRQNTAVPGAVEQGKSSYLIATVAEDLRREHCAVIVLDPKGDAADAAVSLVEPSRTCTLLDFARPTCGFNPLAVDAPADVIADYVVAALRNLFSDADIRASSDRYLRNAIIAVLAYDRRSSLWDAARLLSVGEDGYAYRRAVGARVRELPALSEISMFFTSELSAQLADARGVTTAKLDAPVNKLARLLNSASIKRVLLNDSLRVDFDRVIANDEVLVVKGALGLMGAGNTSVLMQLLVGMLDAALARQQDLLSADRRTAVALKVDEAPLVLNRGFAETIALKRSAGLETVACWQSDAQWIEPEVRDQLDALFAHRVYFATASARDARDAVALTMAEFSDTVRPGIAHLSKLARPDARLYLPKHHAIASWTTREGRQSPFLARTVPLRIDRERLALHAARQAGRGGRYLTDLRQPHWQDRRASNASSGNSVTESGPASGAARRGRGRQGPLRAPSPPRHSARRGASAPSVSHGLDRRKRQAATPDSPCDSYRELIELDLAQSVRWAKPIAVPVVLRPDPLDLDILELIARLRHVLSSQLHRRFNRDRAMTTTQRRLKRLSDAGLVERFQFHRRDGGGVPMCYVISRAGLQLLADVERLDSRGPSIEHASELSSAEVDRDERLIDSRDQSRLRQARHDVHVAGSVLALAELDREGLARINGPVETVLTPPRSPSGGHAPLKPGDLRLPGGRVAHDFLRADGASGELVELERFETIRPDARVELAGLRLDVLVEFSDRPSRGAAAAKLRRYDHFLTGWSTLVRRYGERHEAVPLVVFVCRDRSHARSCAQHADEVLVACRAYAGEYPRDWEYVGRSQVVFVAERDVHEDAEQAWCVPPVPPSVRVSSSHGDPASGELSVERRSLLGNIG